MIRFYLEKHKSVTLNSNVASVYFQSMEYKVQIIIRMKEVQVTPKENTQVKYRY